MFIQTGVKFEENMYRNEKFRELYRVDIELKLNWYAFKGKQKYCQKIVSYNIMIQHYDLTVFWNRG